MSPLVPLLRLLGRGFLPGGRSGRLSILIYHDVMDRPDPLRPWASDIESFDWDMSMLSQCFNVVSLDDAFEGLDRGTLPPRSVAITFDDGYASSARNAVPILKKYGFHATWYLVPGLLDGGRMWNDTAIESIRGLPAGSIDLGDFAMGEHHVDSDRSRKNLVIEVERAFCGRSRSDQLALAEHLQARSEGEISDHLMMTSAEVRALDQAGMGIGSHTETHPVLAQIDPDLAEQEMANGKAGLERILGKEVGHFAYPVGRPGKDYLAVHADIAERLGMTSAVTTGWGVSNASTDRFQIPRFTPWDRSLFRYTARMYQNSRVKPEILARGA